MLPPNCFGQTLIKIMLTNSFRCWRKINKQRFQSSRHKNCNKGLASCDLFFAKAKIGILTKRITAQSKDDVFSLLFSSHVLKVSFGISFTNVTIKYSAIQTLEMMLRENIICTTPFAFLQPHNQIFCTTSCQKFQEKI